MAETTNPTGKKSYETPTLSRINLQPEEAVLGKCKNVFHAGPIASNCTLLSCKTIGS